MSLGQYVVTALYLYVFFRALPVVTFVAGLVAALLLGCRRTAFYGTIALLVLYASAITFLLAGWIPPRPGTASPSIWPLIGYAPIPAATFYLGIITRHIIELLVHH